MCGYVSRHRTVLVLDIQARARSPALKYLSAGRPASWGAGLAVGGSRAGRAPPRLARSYLHEQYTNCETATSPFKLVSA